MIDADGVTADHLQVRQLLHHGASHVIVTVGVDGQDAFEINLSREFVLQPHGDLAFVANALDNGAIGLDVRAEEYRVDHVSFPSLS